MVEATCIKRFMDSDDKTAIEYRLQDTLGNVMDVSAKQLKNAIIQNKIHINNLSLTSNNVLRSTDKRLQCVYINKKIISKIENRIKSLYFKSNVGIKQLRQKAYVIGAKFEQLEKDIYLLETKDSIGIISNKQIALSKNSAALFFDTIFSSIDISDVDVSNTTDKGYMFKFCKAKEINFGNIDTSRVINMTSMFEYCRAKKINFGRIDTSRVTNMADMFRYAELEKIDMSKFNTSNVIYMNRMFEGVGNLKEIDIRNFDTSNVTNMGSMFESCKARTINISGINTKT